MTGIKSVIVLGSFLAAALLNAANAVLVQEEYPLQLVLTLKSYSGSVGNNYYKCGSQGGNNLSMCGYQLQVQAASDGNPVGYELFAKQVYRDELNFVQSQEPGYKNPVRFNLTVFPHNVTVTLTLLYYSSDGRRLNRVFHAELSRVPLALAYDSTDETITKDDWSSFAFNVRIVCRPHNYGAFCSKYCRAENPMQYCKDNGDLACRTTNFQPPCDIPTRKSPVEQAVTAAKKTTMVPKTGAATQTSVELRLTKPLPPAGSPTPDSLGNSQKQPVDPLILTLLLCGAVLAFVVLASGLGLAACMVGRKKPKRVQAAIAINGSGNRPVSFHKDAGPSSSVDILFDNDAIYRSSARPTFSQQQLQQPPPPMPLTSANCDMLLYQRQQQQRGSCSGSSCLCSASVAAGYEPLRLPDGAEMPNLHMAPGGDGHLTAGTLPIIRPPRPFETDTVRSVSRFDTGRNVLSSKAFKC